MNFFDKNFNHILCLDDDDKLRKLISEYLQTNSFIVTQARNSNEATRMLKFYSFNLMILDIMMPGINGITFLKRFREKNQTTPVLMLSAIKNTNSKIKTFNLGCDDYLVKPFEPEELLLRINRLISPRTNKKFRKRVNFGEFEFDFDLGELKKKNKNIKLTTNELIILSYMCNNLNKTLTRDDLIYQLKNQNQSRTIDVVVTRLRKKIENDDKSSFLKTVRGKGYMLNSDYEN